MAHRTFDSLTLMLAAPAGRRGTLRALLGTGLSLVLGRLALSDAAAKKRRKKHKKKKEHHRKKHPSPPGCRPDCAGVCCSGGQSCLGNACWPDSEEMAFGTLLNAHRAAHGLPALRLQNQLGAAAELHSQDQAANTVSSHTGSDGSSPDQRIARAGYAFSWWAENIYYGGGTAAAAFDWWKNSPGHNANMLSTNVTEFGIGRAHSDQSGYWYWTTTFGRP